VASIDGAVVRADRLAHARVRIRVEIVLPIEVGDLLGVGRLGHRVGAGVAHEFVLRELGGGLGGVAGLGRIARTRGLGRGAVLLALDALLEHRVLLQLLLHEIDELHARELQQLDRLLQLRRHHQLLTEADLLLELECHEDRSYASRKFSPR
jgi:hypothetical protein